MTFTDIAAAGGLAHPTIYGGVDRKRFIIETNGAGVALVDVDRDGWLDALVLSGTRLADNAGPTRRTNPADAPTNRLYRNRRDGTFEEVTDGRGLRAHGLGVKRLRRRLRQRRLDRSVRDLLRPNVLYRNRGDGRFEDVTGAAGLAAPGMRWGSGCTFVDIDRDGRLDLFVANYLRFDLQTAPEPGAGSQLHVERHRGELRAEGASDRYEPALPQRGRRPLHRRLRARPGSPASPAATR